MRNKIILIVSLVLVFICGILVGRVNEKPSPLPSIDEPRMNESFSPASVKQRPASLNDKRPNVVLILVDDMRTSDLAFLPKTRKLLGENGITFPNGISPNSVCCPARASLITAQYTHNNGVYTNKGFNGGISALRSSEDTLPVWLQAAGYNTAFFGKYLNGYNKAEAWPKPVGWNWWDATGKWTYAYTRFQFANNGEPETFTKDYITNRLRQRSNLIIDKFSEARKETGRPFFIFDSYVAPHGEIGAPKKDKKAVGPGPIPEKKYRTLYRGTPNPSMLKPSYMQKTKNVPTEWYQEKIKDWTDNQAQKFFLNRIRALASVDDAVEATVNKLKETGDLDNTLIVFTSDNGYLIGEHSLAGKTFGLKESVSVPMIFSGANFAGGKTSRGWATTVDIASTIVRMAKAHPIKRKIDGRDLRQSINQHKPPMSLQPIENGYQEAKSEADERWEYQGFLLGEKYTYINRPDKGEELYNNLRDPYQLVNVAKYKEYQPLLKVFRKQLEQIQGCIGAKQCAGTLTLKNIRGIEPTFQRSNDINQNENNTKKGTKNKNNGKKKEVYSSISEQ